jgi:formylglycine-generating enzyme required for sulfatase activity
MRKENSLRGGAVLTLLSFVWFCTWGNFSIARSGQECSRSDADFLAKNQEKNPGIGEGNVVEKFAKKAVAKPEDKKKKFPWWLAAAGALVAGAAVYFLIKAISNGGANFDTRELGIEWIEISAGEFKMGDNFNVGDSNERPVHAVYLDRYEISKYEVTFEQYDRFCDETSRAKPGDAGWGRADRPVINVSWNDAKAFCDWLSEKTGKNIHLPTEAQWEKAARGTDQRKYPWGNDPPDCSKANYLHCSDKTMAVGSYPAGVSPYGVHDMAGNVWELCSDWYADHYYLASPYENPSGPVDPPFGMLKAERGGGWMATTSSIRCTVRSYITLESPYRAIGFRLCKD